MAEKCATTSSLAGPALGGQEAADPNPNAANGGDNQLPPKATITTSTTSEKNGKGDKKGNNCRQKEKSEEIDVCGTGTTNEILSREPKPRVLVGAESNTTGVSSPLGPKAAQNFASCYGGGQPKSPPTIAGEVGTGFAGSNAAPKSIVTTSKALLQYPAVQNDSVAAKPKRSSPEIHQTVTSVDGNRARHCVDKVSGAPGFRGVSAALETSSSPKSSSHHAMKRPRPSPLPPDTRILEHSSSFDAPQSKISPTAANSLSKPPATLRRGKWTSEEEAYVAQVIHDFNAGYLNAPAGTTLRSYLSEKLQCDPMRITKKFTGSECIGKRVFHPAVRSTSNAAIIDKAQLELDGLERRWRKRLEIQQKESAKKAAAAAASGRHNFSSDALFVNPHGVSLSAYQVHNSTIATMAKWLDRANAVLANDAEKLESSGGTSEAVPANMVEIQLKEVEELIGLGPKIQETFAGLPKLFKESPSLVSVGESSTASHAVDDAVLSLCEASKCSKTAAAADIQEPQAKKPCPDQGSSSLKGAPATELSVADAKDAEALVGFINSVRSQNKSPDEKTTKQTET